MPCVAFCGATVLQRKETHFIWIDALSQHCEELLSTAVDVVVDGVIFRHISLPFVCFQRRFKVDLGSQLRCFFRYSSTLDLDFQSARTTEINVLWDV